ncbi:hypothetical protein RUA4292_00489 [Ruegeria atlantica]|uniref:Uncharacterized protein n=1 Tax=Ruegeria atlantica TaxID=81569 RepID=A0A0N7LPW1_9RHOB|nr:hypothetical protein RUA4292_00489 [Ruegeria atlantica]
MQVWIMISRQCNKAAPFVFPLNSGQLREKFDRDALQTFDLFESVSSPI